jgi:hypothetical protein
MPALTRRRLLEACLFACAGARPSLAANRRGAKLYPDKETAADMSGLKRIFVGWVDLKEEDWAAHGYSTRDEWATQVAGINISFLRQCEIKLLGGRTVAGAKDKGDENAAGYDLYIKFSDVIIDYSKYHLYLSIHFIDPKTNAEIGMIPARPYFGNDWGFEKYLKAALDEASQKLKVEVVGSKPGKAH